MNKFKLFIILIIVIFTLTAGKTAAQSSTGPYFRVNYEIPKMPAEVASKEAVAKNLKLYKQHLQKNKRLMAENNQQAKNREIFVKQHNEITVSLLKDDRREHIRFNPQKCPKPLTVTVLEENNNKVTCTPIDISRGGIGLHSSNMKVNDELPILIKYKNTEIKTTVKIVSSNSGRVSGKFINIDNETNHKLVYLSSLLEADNGLLKTKLAPI